ncbi:MAG: HNH endonuclease [Deltaproteobacteria bacterium]|nr:HNH endonuclease [Deltaproteobacteria bacterium]
MEPELRRLVWQRASQRCEYCHVSAEVTLLPFQIDHIIAEKHGGPTVADNLALSCERCNSHKGPNIAGYLAGQHVALFNPRTDRWTDHFAWDGPVLVGKTPTGKVTIEVLAINLSYRVALRAALIEEGSFPPPEDVLTKMLSEKG